MSKIRKVYSSYATKKGNEQSPRPNLLWEVENFKMGAKSIMRKIKLLVRCLQHIVMGLKLLSSINIKILYKENLAQN